jgi:thiamine kinase-like enzyme
MRPESVIERVWPGRRYTFEPLGGGITNHNFKVVLGDQAFVVRIGGQDTELLGIDRKAEHAAALMAGKIGVGPEVVAFVEPEEYLVTRFIEGRPVPPEEMRSPELIAKVAGSVRAIHEASPIPSWFDSHQVVRTYARTALERGVAPPDDYGWALGMADRIRAARGPQPEVPCHNDLLNANFIDDGHRIRIVDWEYAGMGDRFFDLGNFSIKHEYGPDEELALLTAYFGVASDRDLASVRLMRFMGAFFEAMWGVVQQAISTLDFDYRAYAQENFDRLHAIASEPTFERWLAAVAEP